RSDIQRRLRALETSPRATNMSLRRGAFIVLDESRDERVRLGEHDGIYGLFVTKDDVRTDVTKYVFGSRYASVVTTQSTTSTAVTDLSTAGPSVTVEVGASGRLFVLGGAIIGVDSVGGSFE